MRLIHMVPWKYKSGPVVFPESNVTNKLPRGTLYIIIISLEDLLVDLNAGQTTGTTSNSPGQRADTIGK